MNLSRIYDRQRRRRHSASKTRVTALMAPSLTTSSTRTECCPSDQGRFLGVAQLSNQTAATLPDRDRPLKIKRTGIKGNADEEFRSDCLSDIGLVVFRTHP